MLVTTAYWMHMNAVAVVRCHSCHIAQDEINLWKKEDRVFVHIKGVKLDVDVSCIYSLCSSLN